MPPAYEILLLNTAIPQIQAAQSGDTYLCPRDIAFNAGVNVVNNDVTIYGVTVGRGAGAVATNTAVGASALAANTTGATNAAFGTSALAANTSAANNTAVGAYSLLAATTGGSNSALGTGSLERTTTGAYNVAVGVQALTYNTTASNNTAVGYQAGYANTTGAYNVFVGQGAGSAVITGGGNCFVGPLAGLLSTGSSNTFVGSLVVGVSNGSGAAMTTGSKNTIIGNFSGNQGGLDIRTASNYVVLSDGDGNPRGYFDGTKFAVKSTANDTNTSLMIKKTTGVSTTATDISAAYSDFGQLCIVSGLETSTGNFFTDLVFTCTTGGPTVISSKSVSGSPAGRTYTFPSNFLKLAMASGTYDIHCASWNGI